MSQSAGQMSGWLMIHSEAIHSFFAGGLISGRHARARSRSMQSMMADETMTRYSFVVTCTGT